MPSGNPARACRAFFWQDNQPWPCLADTRRTSYHYCYECWSAIDAIGDATEWPPLDEGANESRWCLGATRVFQLTPHQMQRWILDAVKPPDGWLAEPQPIAASWGVGNRAHEGLFHVYVLRLADGALYIGQTKDVDARVRAHTEGRGARITTKNQPVSLVHSAAVKTRQAAVDAERLLRDAMRRAGMRVSMGEDPDKSEALVTA